MEASTFTFLGIVLIGILILIFWGAGKAHKKASGYGLGGAFNRLSGIFIAPIVTIIILAIIGCFFIAANI